MTQPFKSKTCLIFGMDGFDLCVSINLTLYYASLGFRVFLSRTLFPADVLTGETSNSICTFRRIAV